MLMLLLLLRLLVSQKLLIVILFYIAAQVARCVKHSVIDVHCDSSGRFSYSIRRDVAVLVLAIRTERRLEGELITAVTV